MPRPASLTLHDRDVSSVFDLLGRDENDLTAAFAFTLARSPGLLRRIVQRVAPAASYEEAVLRLEARNSDGRTDLEISAGNHLIVVVAKRGWLVPGETQLVKYAGRVTAHGNGVLVSLSAASHDWARCTLPETIQGIPVAHLPWEEVRLDLTAARIIARGQERAWLEEFADYLRKAIKMRDPAASWTYCVVVSNDRPGDGGPHTYREFVTAEASYFHPYGWGKGWPKTPPNFVAFRWNSQVQQVRRVTRAEVIPDLQSRWPDIPKTVDTIRPHARLRRRAPRQHGSQNRPTHTSSPKMRHGSKWRLTAPAPIARRKRIVAL
jgi:hypothetical protein